MVELTRRSALGVFFATWAAGCSSRPKLPRPKLPDPVEPLPPIGDRIDALAQKHSARIGLFAADLGSGHTVEYHADDIFAVCSTFKTYAAARVLRGCERGELALGDQVFVNPAGVVANSPVTEPRAGHAMALGELCAAALQRSDNTAANLLLTTIGGPPEITAFARSIGDDRTRLDRWELELNSALPGDPRDTSTPGRWRAGTKTYWPARRWRRRADSSSKTGCEAIRRQA